jgi:hypothetical protein
MNEQIWSSRSCPRIKLNTWRAADRLPAEGMRTMAKLDARKSGSFKIGGDIEIHRLGFGAMRITGLRV